MMDDVCEIHSYEMYQIAMNACACEILILLHMYKTYFNHIAS